MCFYNFFQAEQDLRNAQTEFDRQSELTKLLMDELNVTYVSVIFYKFFLKINENFNQIEVIKFFIYENFIKALFYNFFSVEELKIFDQSIFSDFLREILLPFT